MASAQFLEAEVETHRVRSSGFGGVHMAAEAFDMPTQVPPPYSDCRIGRMKYLESQNVESRG